MTEGVKENKLKPLFLIYLFLLPMDRGWCSGLLRIARTIPDKPFILKGTIKPMVSLSTMEKLVGGKRVIKGLLKTICAFVGSFFISRIVVEHSLIFEIVKENGN